MATTETRRIQFEFTARDRGVQRTTQEASESIEDMNDGLEQGSGKAGKFGAVAGKLGPILGAVAGAAALIAPAITKGLDAQAATAKFQAQLGLSAKESERIGGVAGKLYSQAYGESMDEVREAIKSVVQNMDGMRTASNADLQSTTARAMDLAQVLGEEVGPVTNAVSQMMRTGLAKNSKEAFDVLTRGVQLGANKAEDLLDTFNEYSTQFRDLGLNGAQAMGIITQGLKGGARDADIVADALKELNIRVQSMAAAEGLGKLGLNADKMAAAFGKGGPVARNALDQITDRLRAVHDPTKRYALAQQILGTQSEDMGKALLKIDPSKATAELGKFAGATDRAGKAMGGTLKARLTGFKRTLETQVTNVAAKALTGLSRLAGEVKKGFKLPPAGKAANDWQKFGVEIRKVGDWAKTRLVPALKDTATWVEKKVMPPVIKFYKTVLVELGKQIRRVARELDNSGIPWGKILKVMQAVYGFAVKYLLKLWGIEFKIALKIVGTWITYSIKSFGLLWKVLEIGWKSVKKGWQAFLTYYKIAKPAVDKIRDAVARSTTIMIRMFLAFAVNVVKGAAKAFGWVPGLGGKLKKAERSVEGFAKQTNRWIDSIRKSKTVSLKVNAKGFWSTAHDPSRRIPGLAKGGPVPAMWDGASQHYDSQPALLRVNEHVWTPEEVSDVGGHGAMLRLRAAARRGLLKGFASGGPVVSVNAHTPSAAAFRHDVIRPVDAGYTGMVRSMAGVLAKILKKLLAGSGSVVAAARSMIGYPYSWGGGGKGGPSFGIGRGTGTYGFDCSGLTEYAWWKGARVGIGGTTYEQWPNSSPTARRPGALGFPHMGHVVIASDKQGYIIQAPFTGSHVQEVASGRSYSWRWPKGAKYYAGGPVGQFGREALRGPDQAVRFAEALGVLGNPARHRALGGPVTAGEPYLVGERGAEVMVPRTSGTVHASGTRVIQVNGPLVQVSGHVVGDLDEVKLTRIILEAEKKAAKRGVDVRRK